MLHRFIKKKYNLNVLQKAEKQSTKKYTSNSPLYLKKYNLRVNVLQKAEKRSTGTKKYTSDSLLHFSLFIFEILGHSLAVVIALFLNHSELFCSTFCDSAKKLNHTIQYHLTHDYRTVSLHFD